jgi:hypothetical protein
VGRTTLRCPICPGTLRFGFKASGTQKPGGYAAPITFDVLAPAV